MKREEQIIQILEAFLKGKRIEFRSNRDKNRRWLNVQNPSWDFSNLEYRIAPPRADWIDWSHVNSKFRYMARDYDGLVYLFMCPPEIRSGRWSSTMGEMINASSFTSLRVGETDWKESLVERPHN